MSGWKALMGTRLLRGHNDHQLYRAQETLYRQTPQHAHLYQHDNAPQHLHLYQHDITPQHVLIYQQYHESQHVPHHHGF